MAKWGEGDPRWIVEERPDAINVNNWHWTERNACGWSKSKFEQLFTDYSIGNDMFECKITSVDKQTGEAVANNRKGKLIFFYEWELTLLWEGKLTSAENIIKGKIVVPNLSEENEVDEIDVDISTNESTPEGDVLKTIMKELTVKSVREQLSKYIQGLKAEFSQGMILPSKGSSEDTANKNSITSIPSGVETKVQFNSNVVSGTKSTSNIVSTPGSKLKTSTVELRQTFKCTGPELYEALTVHELVSAFTHGPVTLDLKQGGKFELFGGNVSGEFVELIPNLKIVQKWRCKRWPSDHYSIVTIEITQQSDHAELYLVQTGVPQEEVESITENWERYYFDALKRTFGIGHFL